MVIFFEIENEWTASDYFLAVIWLSNFRYLKFDVLLHKTLLSIWQKTTLPFCKKVSVMFLLLIHVLRNVNIFCNRCNVLYHPCGMLLIVKNLKTVTVDDCDYKTLCMNPHQILVSIKFRNHYLCFYYQNIYRVHLCD